MLEEQIQEQGRDPRACKTALQLRGFLSRANKTIPFYFGTLAELERPVNTVPRLSERHTVVTIHSLLKLTNADKKTQKLPHPGNEALLARTRARTIKISHSLPPLALLHFWIFSQTQAALHTPHGKTLI